MKFSQQWLYDWVNPGLTTEELTQQLTMAGLEVDHVLPVAGDFSGVVVGKVLETAKHPQADKLTLCQVDIGQAPCLSIVCGASNVKPGMLVAVATVGAKVGDLKIKPAKLRGEISQGMLCSAKELGLAEQSQGILALPHDAPLGRDVRDYLQLDDVTIDVDLTPNRGDCLSILGLAREVAALNHCTYKTLESTPVDPAINDVLRVNLQQPQACPQYVGRIIRGIDAQAATPRWMQERLRRSGVRSISPVVDVTNYVMLELGQPLHAFDLASIDGNIRVRLAHPKETLLLLNDQEVSITADSLVIADDKKALALAGIMGGKTSAVTDSTQAIFLESAYFSPVLMAGKARQYGLSTDSSHRFERGVDPQLQATAIHRATALLLDIVGGQAGPLVSEAEPPFLPTPQEIVLRPQRVQSLLGVTLSVDAMQSMLQGLALKVERENSSLKVTVPTHRFDLCREVDLIEEVARVYGYDQLPLHETRTTLSAVPHLETQLALDQFSQLLVGRSYREVISYSFTDPAIQALLFPEQPAQTLVNAISPALSQMRLSLWPGLLSALRYNQNRQQANLRLFETGLVFVKQENALEQTLMIAGVLAGKCDEDNWLRPARELDFYDLKRDVLALFALTKRCDEVTWVAAEHSALHPGKSAKIFCQGKQVGWIGGLHPAHAQQLDIHGPVYVFECQYEGLRQAVLPSYQAVSKFPEIRRDLAFLIDRKVTASEVEACIVENADEWLRDVIVFDNYAGPDMPEDKKSVAVGLIMQHQQRTLVDEEVNALVERVLAGLYQTFSAVLRS